MGKTIDANLYPLVAQRFEMSTEQPQRFFSAEADRLAEACLAMARRFHRGGRLLAIGNGARASDAQHVAVEFVHPVIAGNRALPALVIAGHASGTMAALSHELAALAEPQDMVMGFVRAGADAELEAALAAARQRGLLTLAFTGASHAAASLLEQVDHRFAAGSDDPLVQQEIHETAYHVLWELVHVFFHHRGLLEDQPPEPANGDEADADEQAWLYPFLASAPQPTVDATLAQVRESIQLKSQEIGALRRRVAAEEAQTLVDAACTIHAAFAAGHRLWIFGNGGSATDAADLATDFRSPPLPGHRPLPTFDISSDVATITAVANDVGFENVFVRQLIAFARAGDVAMGISTSGNSANMLAAFETAHRRGLRCIALSGDEGGRVRGLADAGIIDHLIVVPCAHIPRIQEAHATINHTLWHLVHRLLEDPAP